MIFVAAMLLVAACGGGGDTELSPGDRVVVAGFELDVAATVLDGSRYGQLLDSVDAVIDLARSNPDAIYRTEAGGPRERTMRQVLSDAASTLAPYQPALAAKLDRAVETLP